MSMEHCWKDIWQRKSEIIGEKSVSVTTFSTSNSTWITLRFNSGLRDEKLVTNLLNYRVRPTYCICMCVYVYVYTR
jgi:hypothetical protein